MCEKYMGKMKVAHLPHSKLRVAFRELPVACAELSNVVMTENTHTVSCNILKHLISVFTEWLFLSYPPSLSQSYTSIFIALKKKKKKVQSWKACGII